MNVTETLQITARTIEKVVVHPLVLRNIVDDYNRVAKKSGKRVVGVLLGGSSNGIVDVINSYPVPFKEDDKDPCGGFFDHKHHRSMFQLFHGINDMVGWYSTGPELRDHDLYVHAQFCQYAPNPVMVVIDVGLGIPTNAYYTMSSLDTMSSLEKIIEKEVFVRASLEIPPHEVKDSGEHYKKSV